MTEDYINKTGTYILQLILFDRLFLCWGVVDKFKGTVFKDMAALEFIVTGTSHQGIVIIAYNEGSDLFDIYFFKGNDKSKGPIDIIKGVYFDQLNIILEDRINNVEIAI